MSTYTAAQKVCSEAELKRFACCLLNCKDYLQAVDWDAAAADYGGNAKAASFKTMTLKAVNKAVKAASEEGGDGGKAAEVDGEGGEGKKGKAKGKAAGGGKKRKAAEEADGAAEAEAEGEEKKPAAKKAKGGKRGRKATTPAAEAAGVEDGENIDVAGGEGETVIKAEEDDAFT